MTIDIFSYSEKKTKASLKKSKTYKIKASVRKLRIGRKLMPKSKGRCKVYVIAVNGAKKAITVTVK